MNDNASGRKLHLYLTTSDLEDKPELRVAKSLGLQATRFNQPSLEAVGDQGVRDILTEHHDAMGVDFTVKQVPSLEHGDVKTLVEKYTAQGYQVHQITIV